MGGEIALTLRVLPAEPTTDLTSLEAGLKGALPENARLAGSEVKPFAFGLKALMCSVIIPEDEEGLADRVEEALRGVDHVQGVELLTAGRL